MSSLTPRLAALLTLPPLMWAGNAVVGRLMVGQVPPLTMNLLRWSLVMVILLPLGWRALRSGAAIREHWRYLALTSLLGVGLFNALQYLALVTSTPINVTLVGSSLPVWMLLVGTLVFRTRATPAQVQGALLGLAGVALVIGRGSWETLMSVRFVPGDLIMLVAVIGWAFYSWLLARPPARMRGEGRPAWDWAGLLLVQVMFGIGPAAILSGGEHLVGAQPIHWSAGVAVALLYVAMGPSIVAYRCWGLGVSQGGPALAAFFNNLTPLFAAVMSALVLGEAPRPYHAVAFLFIVAGIAWPLRRRAM